MRRRNWLQAIAALFAIKPATAKLPLKKFYITTGRYDCHIPPIESWGVDSLDALANSGLTVWSEDSWLRAEKGLGGDFRQSKACKPAGTLQEAIARSREQDLGRHEDLLRRLKEKP